MPVSLWTSRSVGGRGGACSAGLAVMAGLALGVSGAWAQTSGVRVIAAAGPGGTGELVSALPAATYFAQFDHASASPGGSIVVVGSMAGDIGTGGAQGVWVRPAGDVWKLAARMDFTAVDAPGSRLMSVLTPPIANDRGEALVVALMQLPGSTGAIVTQPSLVRLDAGGTGRLLLRFNTGAGTGFPGVPAGLPTGFAVAYNGGGMDGWRLTDAGALYASSINGLLADCGTGTMCFRTMTTRSLGTNGQGTPTAVGTAVPVTTARNAIGLTAAGPSFQHVSMSGYTRDQLAGLLMFDEWGIASFAVRDGTTPIEGMPGQFVLSSAGSSQDLSGGVGVNSGCAAVFQGRYGPIPVNTGLNPTVPPPVTGPLGLFVKPRWSAARLIAEASPSAATARSVAPGLPGWRFASLGSSVVNAGGTVVFSAGLTSTVGTRSSLWMYSEATGLRAIAVTNTATGSGSAGSPPATHAGQFMSFRTAPMLNRLGQVVFIAQVVPSGSTAAYDALCAFDPGAGVTVLARTGNVLAVPGLGERTMTSLTPGELGGRGLPATGNDDGAATMITDDGLVIFRAVAGGSGVVATVTVPRPSGACCAGATCEVKASLDCAGRSHRFTGAGTVCQIGSGAAGCCPADFDQSGAVSVQDLFDYILAWSALEPTTDMNGDAVIDAGDIIGYVQSYFRGCP